MTKYNLSESTIASAGKLHQWIFLLLHAHEYDAPRLKKVLPGIEFDQAINAIAADLTRKLPAVTWQTVQDDS